MKEAGWKKHIASFLLLEALSGNETLPKAYNAFDSGRFLEFTV